MTTPLEQWLDDAPRPWREVLHVFVDVGRALASAHAEGRVYQEVRSENIFVGPEGRAEIRDLKAAVTDLPKVGPAGLRTAAVSLEQRLAEMRSTEAAAYLAPEQFKGWVADARSNQFSYCVAFYRALYRQAPFDHDWATAQMGDARARRTPLGSIHFALVVQALDRKSLINLAREVLSENLRPPPEDTEVPGWLDATLRRGLRSDPDERYASMNELVDDLRGQLGGGTSGRAMKVPRDYSKWVLLGGIVLLVLLGDISKVAGWGR
jgi:serine/threonine protein kinase